MKVEIPGHIYLLDVLDGHIPVRLPFVQRVGQKYPGNKVAHPGTTSQEVLRALIDRAVYVNNQTPCIETEMGLRHLEMALVMFEMRAKRVKNEHLDDFLHNTDGIGDIISAPTCTVCGHVFCDTHGHN